MKIPKKASLLLLCCMTGCNGQETELPSSPAITVPQETATVEDSSLSVQKNQNKKEIPVDFPFFESEPYTLMLALTDESRSEYELRLYDKYETILQQIPCGTLTEPIRFSYDGLIYGTLFYDLEIFPADSSTGLFFDWNEKENRFSENPVEIPKYEEIRGIGMLSTTEADQIQTKIIYQYNKDNQCAYEMRRWELQKDTGTLKIWDCLEEQILFEGILPLDEDGNPENNEYYDMLFWDSDYLLYDYSCEPSVKAWIDEPRAESTKESQGVENFEYVQKEVFGNNGHTETYESREALLTEFGFEHADPMYQYFDQYHNLQLELYHDETTGQFCGIVYQYRFNNERKKMKELWGFTINTVWEDVWTNRDPFSTTSISGRDGADEVKNYNETIALTPDGRLDYFQSEGIINSRGSEDESEEAESIVKINFVYRDDGTLYYRDYSHNSYLFGTTLLSLDSYYDEYGRAVYEYGYITHGSLEYYYLYQDDHEKPAYCLELDHNLGYVIPTMIQYR
ncbi:MAG: hypothetical protein K2N73_00175 [Lachnospiraceae bacterium]|nr:hypothetical protein [Lachnospiraceae bacterium]